MSRPFKDHSLGEKVLIVLAVAVLGLVLVGGFLAINSALPSFFKPILSDLGVPGWLVFIFGLVVPAWILVTIGEIFGKHESKIDDLLEKQDERYEAKRRDKQARKDTKTSSDTDDDDDPSME